MSFEEIEFLSALQSFTIHCVSNQSSSKIQSHCNHLLSAVKNLSKFYIGHKIQIALALESASQRNESRLILNDHMNIISHLIYLCRPNFELNEEEKSEEWTGINLLSLLNQCENRFKEQTFLSTVWIEIMNETSLVSRNINYFNKNLFDFVQHDTDIQQLFQWIDSHQIKISGKFNRTYQGVPLFWCTPLESHSQSKYGSIRLIFSFSLIYSSNQHHIFDLGTRKNKFDIWNNILITKRKQIAGYGINFNELLDIPSSPVDIAIDLTDGPLILPDVRIIFVDHTQRCVPILPDKLTSQHSCYNTSQSAMFNFIRYLRQHQQFTLDQLKHFFDLSIFEKLQEINKNLSIEQINL